MDVKEIIQEVTEKIQQSANIKAVFGDPVERANITVIPVSKTSISGGGGGGFGHYDDEDRPKGGGLGMRVKTTPVGYIELTNDSARFVEIAQPSKIIMAGMALGAFTVFSFSRVLLRWLKN